ncbi:hypothetical protein DDP54_01885 [Cellulomonas sp. WB94]|uniref:hypothetical protein n=1 Tax=Cellulomonas sp. WB94 TaxID=2173174 RepID=UPI000D587112|nr:hypothetical protein [Cellulomonas sp. WB94]PVU81965.1 hypothetical protein DDP54_01885 [Cellulomonas sp. WB94]
MQVSAASTTTDLTALQRQLLVDQRTLAEHVKASADASTIAADQVAVQTDELAIAQARSGSLDVLA